MHAWRYSLHHSVFFSFCSIRVVSTIKRLPSNNTLVHTCTIFNNSNQRFLRTYSTINLLLSSPSRYNSSDTCTFIILHGRYTNSPSGEQRCDKDATTWSFFTLYHQSRDFAHIFGVSICRSHQYSMPIDLDRIDGLLRHTRTSSASNQPTNPATTLTNKRRRLAFSIHFLSSATCSTLFFFAHAESNLVTRNNGCVPASIVHIFLQHLPETFSTICKYYQTIQNKRHHKFVPLLVHRSAHLIFDYI